MWWYVCLVSFHTLLLPWLTAVCVDGILNIEFGKLVAQGKGSIHGIDSSAAMIKSAQELCKDVPTCTFEGLLLIIHLNCTQANLFQSSMPLPSHHQQP
jgi:hypothetical protein